ncbi:MAG: sulfite exporter TauE/SafE family protein [Agarilytica sp.]
MLAVLLIGFTAMATSTFAGITGGVGGGMLLLACMPFFLPVEAIIPVHGVSQLASNASRALMAIKHMAWRYLPGFLLGSVLGIFAAWQLLRAIQVEWLPLCIGIYILCHVWWPAFKNSMSRFENFFLIGLIQTGLNPIVGATSPLTATLAMAKLKEKEAIVATNSVMMSFSHFSKTALFVFLGFEYREYWKEMLIMSLGAILGSYLGTLVRRRIDGARFIMILKAMLSALAIKMVAETLITFA